MGEYITNIFILLFITIAVFVEGGWWAILPGIFLIGQIFGAWAENKNAIEPEEQ